MMMAFDAMTEISDAVLMGLYGKGDAQAARVLSQRHAPRALALANRLLRDRAEAEDVAQEAMMKLWKIAPDWRQGEAKVSTWLYRVVANACTDRLRRRRDVDLQAIAEPADPAPGMEQALIAGDRANALRGAMDCLPERQRLAVTLRHLEDLSNPEIAEIMQISVEAVESLIARGKRALAKLLLGRRETLGLDR
jgi:RNA polymerase sigma-70 factor, ECF subfamily